MAILLAGGNGSRMGNACEDKILLEINGQAVFAHVLRAFVGSGTQDGLVVVARDHAQEQQLAAIVAQEAVTLPVRYTLGGSERRDSVRNGLDCLPAETRFVSIHDCARPAVTPASLEALRAALMQARCAVSLAHRVTDTVRQFDAGPLQSPTAGELLPRDRLWAMETPQAFPRELIERAHQHCKIPVTDDLAAVEALGEPILLVESPDPNPKLTRPADVPLLASLLSPTPMNTPHPPFRTGLGYDIHRLIEGRPLVLGGVSIPAPYGLEGHSDADVLSHAIADALLGGCGLPDIGHYFPNTDASIKGLDSRIILARAIRETSRLGYRVLNIDATLIAERPRLAPYIEAMKTALSGTLGIPSSSIGIKATTQERIGALGRGEGIAAHAIASLSS